MKCERLDIQASGAMESITAHMTFDNFDQSMRFLNLIINFIREEKANAKAPHAPEAEASQHEAAVEGQVQDQPQASCWQDRQHPVKTDTGSVT